MVPQAADASVLSPTRGALQGTQTVRLARAYVPAPAFAHSHIVMIVSGGTTTRVTQFCDAERKHCHCATALVCHSVATHLPSAHQFAAQLGKRLADDGAATTAGRSLEKRCFVHA